MKSKKILAFLVVVVLLIGGYGILRYMEKAVIGKVREVEHLLSPHLSLGGVRFSLWDKRLTLTDLRLRDDKSDATYEIKRLEGVLPLELIFDTPEGETELFSEWIAHDSTYREQNFVETWREQRVTHLRADPARLLRRLRSGAAEGHLFLMLLTNISYEREETEDLRIKASATEQAPAHTISIKRAGSAGYRNGDYAALEMTDLRLTAGNKDIAALDSLTLTGVHCPPPPVLKSFLDIKDPDGLEALGVLQSLFTGPKPLVERLQLKNLTVTTPELPLHLAALTVDWPSSRPTRYSIDLKDLSLPVTALMAVVPGLRLPGLETLHVDFKDAVTHEDDGRSQETISLTVRDVASLSLDVVLQGQPSSQGDPMLSLYMSQFVRAEALLQNERLMAYVGGNLDPSGTDAAELLEDKLERVLALFLDPSSAASVREQLAAFVRRPGTLKLTFAPKTPVALLELAGGTFDIASALTAVATPGPTPLEQQIRQLFAPRPKE